MIVSVNGDEVFVSQGGLKHRAGQKALLLLHSSGINHTIWASQSHYLAHRGINLFALDLPGHGRSAGPFLTSIGQMSAWLDAFMTAAGLASANLLGHSMGALVAIDFAAANPARCDSIILAGVAASMSVNPQLLGAAKENDPLAIELIESWSYAKQSHPAGHEKPDGSATTRRPLLAESDGVLFADLNACNDYYDAQQNFRALQKPVTVIAGAQDRMTPAKAGKALADSREGTSFVLIEAAGHNMMIERADEFNRAVRDALGV